MRRLHRHRHSVARWVQMAALRAAICNALSGWWKHNVGIQVLWDLTTVARQPGETAVSALKLSHSSPDYVRATSPAFLFLNNMKKTK